MCQWNGYHRRFVQNIASQLEHAEVLHPGSNSNFKLNIRPWDLSHSLVTFIDVMFQGEAKLREQKSKRSGWPRNCDKNKLPMASWHPVFFLRVDGCWGHLWGPIDWNANPNRTMPMVSCRCPRHRRRRPRASPKLRSLPSESIWQLWSKSKTSSGFCNSEMDCQYTAGKSTGQPSKRGVARWQNNPLTMLSCCAFTIEFQWWKKCCWCQCFAHQLCPSPNLTAPPSTSRAAHAIASQRLSHARSRGAYGKACSLLHCQWSPSLSIFLWMEEILH